MIEPRAALQRAMAGASLSQDETEHLFGLLMDGEVPASLQAALLVALRIKGETADELAGAARAMRRRVLVIPHSRPSVVDTCGTGGDGKGTFNVSTAAAFVAAGAGVPIAKHGNRAVSSKSGSADVLAALGVAIEATPEDAARALDEIGIAFLFAPRLHPAMARVAAVRKELGVRTVFNLLGPLTNPAGARRQVMGVFDGAYVGPIAEVLAALGAEHAMVVHGSDGLDEITITGPTRVAEVRDGELRLFELDPRTLGVPRAAAEALAGGSAEQNAEHLRRVLAGEPGPLADITAVNAAAAIYVAGLASDLAEGLERARAAIASGAAADKLARLAAFGRGPS